MKRYLALLTCLLTVLVASPLLATWEDGVAAFKAGRYEDAANVFQTFVTSRPKAPEGYYMLGMSLMRQKRLSEAIGPLSDALTLSQGDPRYRMTLGQAQLQARKPGDALDTLSAQDPATVPKTARASYHQLLAKAATSCGRDTDGYNSLKKALGADQSSKVLWLARGNLAHRLGRASDAFEALSKAFELDPSDPEPGRSAVQTALAIAQTEANGDRRREWYAEGVGIADRLVTSFPTATHLRLAAGARMGAQDYSGAVELFEKALADDDQDPMLHYDLGRCRQTLGQGDEALDHLAMALERSPDEELTSKIYLAQARVFRGREDFDAAAEAFRQAGDTASADEMEGYAKNRREVAQATAECVGKRDELQKLILESKGLEHTPEYRQLEADLAAIKAACSSYFSDVRVSG